MIATKVNLRDVQESILKRFDFYGPHKQLEWKEEIEPTAINAETALDQQWTKTAAHL